LPSIYLDHSRRWAGDGALTDGSPHFGVPESLAVFTSIGDSPGGREISRYPMPTESAPSKPSTQFLKETVTIAAGSYRQNAPDTIRGAHGVFLFSARGRSDGVAYIVWRQLCTAAERLALQELAQACETTRPPKHGRMRRQLYFDPSRA